MGLCKTIFRLGKSLRPKHLWVKTISQFHDPSISPCCRFLMEDDNEEEVEARKKCGRPTGSTLDHSRAQVLARKQAINYVCVQYAKHQEDREKIGVKRV